MYANIHAFGLIQTHNPCVHCPLNHVSTGTGNITFTIYNTDDCEAMSGSVV